MYELVGKDEMPRAAYREPLSNALDNTKECNLYEFHTTSLYKEKEKRQVGAFLLSLKSPLY